jgi:2'-5' RNA ligase
MEIRSFLAFDLPPEIRKIVAQVSGELRKSSLDVRWVKVENIHPTVVFMGNIKEEDITPINDLVQEVCLSSGPFDVLLKGLGSFPNPKNPRVLWIGLDGDLERMSHFRDALQKQLRPFGIKEEKRRFKPHLTLGRFRKYKRGDPTLDEMILRYHDLTDSVFSLNELSMFRSDLKPGGAKYTKLESWPLSGKK